MCDRWMRRNRSGSSRASNSFMPRYTRKRRPRAVHGDVVVVGLEPLDVGDGDRQNPSAIADEDARQRHRSRRADPSPRPRAARPATSPSSRTARFDAFERGEQTVAAERLEQIVDRLELERGDGELVVRRREHDRRIVLNATQHVEPVELRHLDVEKDEIGLELVDRRRPPSSVGRLADALDPLDLGDQVAQLPPRDRLILDDDGARLHAGAVDGGAAPRRPCHVRRERDARR